MRLFHGCVYAIIEEDRLLAADHGVELSEPLCEGKPWSAASKWLTEAAHSDECVPIVFANAKWVHRWLGWAILTHADIDPVGQKPRQTAFRFRNLRPLIGHARDEFVVAETGKPLPENHIRSYVLFQTPELLHRLSGVSDAPLLSDWLRTTEAVAHVFDANFDDAETRVGARQLLEHAIDIVKELAPGEWTIVTTPDRIRLMVGDGVAVDLGERPGTWGFFCDLDDEEPDDDLSPIQMFEKYESGFRAHVEGLRGAPPKDQGCVASVLEYLRNPPACALDSMLECGLDAPDVEALMTAAFPDTAERAVVLHQLVRSADVANSFAPNAWAVTLFRDGFRLNVGPVEVLVCTSEFGVHLNLVGEVGMTPFIGGLFRSTKYKSQPHPQCGFYGPISEFTRVQELLQPGHAKFVRRAASNKSGEPVKGTPFRRSHSEALMQYARRVVAAMGVADADRPRA